VGLDTTEGFLAGALNGSAGSRGELLERLRPRLVLWVAARLSSALRAKVEPEDVAQDILLAVHRDFASFHGDDPRAFYRWFFTVAENRIRDLADHYGALKRQLPPPLTFSQTSPSTAAARTEDVARVMRAIETLPDSHREVITLLRIEERSVAEAAEILGKSENAVRILYCRALKDLRAALGAPA
jgi:RNA polymerase sigma-70 factor (ECF subfamily)